MWMFPGMLAEIFRVALVPGYADPLRLAYHFRGWTAWEVR